MHNLELCKMLLDLLEWIALMTVDCQESGKSFTNTITSYSIERSEIIEI